MDTPPPPEKCLFEKMKKKIREFYQDSIFLQMS